MWTRRWQTFITYRPGEIYQRQWQSLHNCNGCWWWQKQRRRCKKIENTRIGSSRVQQAEFVHRRPAASGWDQECASIWVGNSQIIWFFSCKGKSQKLIFCCLDKGPVSYKICKREKGLSLPIKNQVRNWSSIVWQLKKEKQHSIFRSVEEKLDQILFRLDESVQVSLSFIAKHFCTVSSKMHLYFWPWKWGPSNIRPSHQRL